jgi:P27 family predicted phage terminase small subunit
MPRGVLPKSARKLWREWVPELQELGLATPLDAPMLMLACVWGGIVADAARMIRDAEERRPDGQGLVTTDDRGRERKNRALTALRAASSELRQLSRAFGLTPADRAGIEVPPEDDGLTLADMLFNMAEVDDGDQHRLD